MTEDIEISKLIKIIDEEGYNLNNWELEFIASMLDNPPKKYTKNQINKIKQIYDLKT